MLTRAAGRRLFVELGHDLEDRRTGKGAPRDRPLVKSVAHANDPSQPWFGTACGCSTDASTARLLSAAACGETLLPETRMRSVTKRGRMDDSCLKSLSVGTGPSGAADRRPRARGAAPGLFWLGGFKSDMRGTKAEALDAWAGRNGRAMVRFDYSGHGESGGDLRRRHHRPLAGGERRRCFAAAARARRSRSARPWAAGSRCCWRASWRGRAATAAAIARRAWC